MDRDAEMAEAERLRRTRLIPCGGAFVTRTDKQRSRFRTLLRMAMFSFVRGSGMAAGGCAVSALAWLVHYFVG